MPVIVVYPDDGFGIKVETRSELVLLIARSRVLLEKLTRSQLVKKFLTFNGTRRFITALTSARLKFLTINRSCSDCVKNFILKGTLSSNFSISHPDTTRTLTWREMHRRQLRNITNVHLATF
jgi:hypothetical protein